MKNIEHLRIPETIIFHKHYDAFRVFFYNNPHVWYTLYEMVNDAVTAGARNLSIKHALGAIRWNMNIKTNKQEGEYKINDAYTSLYAAIMAENYPELACHFEQRKLKSGSIHF